MTALLHDVICWTQLRSKGQLQGGGQHPLLDWTQASRQPLFQVLHCLQSVGRGARECWLLQVPGARAAGGGAGGILGACNISGGAADPERGERE